MRLSAAILLGKIIAKIIHLLKIGGGSAAPGLFALKLDPDLVIKLSAKIPQNIIITGTNGKTTTARMIALFAKANGLKVIRNHTGSNLERGIASTLIHHTSLGLNVINTGGWLDRNLGVWELDEAAFNSVTPKIKPNIVVFLNVFRDQLDRYGEVDSVVKKWCNTLKSLTPQTVVLLNGDDANTAKLAHCFEGKVVTFGVKDYKLVGESLEKKPSNKKLDFEAKNVILNGLKGSTFQLSFNHKSHTIHLPLPGIYHIYDALAAITCATHFSDIPINRLSDYLINFQPAFGRVEKLPFGFIFLIKNPAGATQVFETIAPQIKPNDRLLLALNDNLADGTDVSWIWDANFEVLLQNLSRAKSRDLSLYVSGTRTYDLANRLKYAGFDSHNIMVESDLKKALRQARDGLKGKLFILPTYTAMLELQGILAHSGLKKHYWEES
ncbi:DUF1727 domain-containing protein [Candidatus Daviesbacteria bacterium]|nr:DUF1727 domain-containing protein [Candidatus Daviesbacteria bacterium]